jgi:hypothetical protein
MNENGFWQKVRKEFKAYKVGAAWKVQDAYRSGLPDADCIASGVVMKFELKYAEAWPKRKGALKTTLKPSQRAHLMEWDRAGGNAFVLLGVGDEWFLLHPNVCRGDGKFYEDEVKDTYDLKGTMKQRGLKKLVEWVAEGPWQPRSL